MSAFCTKNGARRSGDKGGDKFGGLTCHKPKPRRAAALRARSSAGCRAAGNSATPELGNWAAFAHFFDPKASGDKAEANGDKLSGLEFACFSEQKTESGERLEPDFDRKRANLEAQAPRLTSDTKKTNFSELAVLSAFCTKKRSGDEAVTSLVTSSAG